MVFAGFGFKKVSVEKFESPKGKLNVDIKIDITNITNPEFKFGDKETAIFEFSFKIIYTPKIAELELTGSLAVADESKAIKKIIDDWKDKKIEETLRLSIINTIMSKCNVKALSLEEDLGLPFHIPMPKVKAGKSEKAEKKAK